MSKKHYIAVAKILRQEYEIDTVNQDFRIAIQGTVIRIASALASEFASDNPNFSRQRFMDAITD